MPVVHLIQYVYNSCTGPRLDEFAHFCQEMHSHHRRWSFFMQLFLARLKGRGVLTPLDYPVAPGWSSVGGRRPFMLTPRLLGREG